MSGKYRVPSMSEIEKIPFNGYKVVSTFSGAGGSCLGYRMAGYHVVWANEFIPEAQKTYKANHKFPSFLLIPQNQFDIVCCSNSELCSAYANDRISRQEFKVLLGLYNIGEENACSKGLAKLLRRTKRLEKIDI